MRKSRPARRPARRGLSLVEALISLAICAMLLTAVAGAFSASAQAIENNDSFFRATQAARVSLTHMLTQLRRVEEIEIGDGGKSVSFFKLNPATEEEERYTYQYSPDTRELRLIRDDGVETTSNRLCGNVAKVEFQQDTDDINGDNVQFVVRISVAIEVEAGDNKIRLAGSAVPRRNLRYE